MKKGDFKVGQDVFYPTAGVGVIEGMEEVVFGVEHELCYVIRIPENRVTIKVPKTRAVSNGLRPLLHGKGVKELLAVLADKSSARPAGPWAEHYKDLERRIQSGGVLQVGSAVRDLLRLKAEAGLSFEEARLLELADGYLTRELAVAQGVSLEAAREVIRGSVGLGT
ncbi:MAG: CarD family transcriptional regulator [Acidiferrobacter sp.]